MSSIASPDAAQVARAWGDLFRYQLGEPDALERMQALLALGADPNDYGQAGATPLNVVLRSGKSPWKPLQQPWEEMLRTLLAAGADPNLPCAHEKMPLSAAAAMPSVAGVQMLLAAGANPIVPDGFEQPIHVAIKNNRPAVLAALLAAGASVDAPDREGETPLARAIQDNEFKYAALLIDHGACLDRQGQLQRSAVCLICQRPISSASTDLLLKVLRMGADPNAPDLLGRTPLVYLLSQLNGDNPADLAVVKIMLRNGADPRICDNQGQDLFSAIKGRHLPITTDFLRQAIVDLDVRELEQATPVSPPRSSAPRL